jgi:hypothetical protein
LQASASPLNSSAKSHKSAASSGGVTPKLVLDAPLCKLEANSNPPTASHMSASNLELNPAVPRYAKSSQLPSSFSNCTCEKTCLTLHDAWVHTEPQGQVHHQQHYLQDMVQGLVAPGLQQQTILQGRWQPNRFTTTWELSEILAHLAAVIYYQNPTHPNLLCHLGAPILVMQLDWTATNMNSWIQKLKLGTDAIGVWALVPDPPSTRPNCLIQVLQLHHAAVVNWVLGSIANNAWRRQLKLIQCTISVWEGFGQWMGICTLVQRIQGRTHLFKSLLMWKSSATKEKYLLVNASKSWILCHKKDHIYKDAYTHPTTSYKEMQEVIFCWSFNYDFIIHHEDMQRLN